MNLSLRETNNFNLLNHLIAFCSHIHFKHTLTSVIVFSMKKNTHASYVVTHSGEAVIAFQIENRNSKEFMLENLLYDAILLCLMAERKHLGLRYIFKISSKFSVELCKAK